jgi:hypothetical protein
VRESKSEDLDDMPEKGMMQMAIYESKSLYLLLCMMRREMYLPSRQLVVATGHHNEIQKQSPTQN